MLRVKIDTVAIIRSVATYYWRALIDKASVISKKSHVFLKSLTGEQFKENRRKRKKWYRENRFYEISRGFYPEVVVWKEVPIMHKTMTEMTLCNKFSLRAKSELLFLQELCYYWNYYPQSRFSLINTKEILITLILRQELLLE